MMLDIAALQELYGADFEVNAGDSVYRWKPGSGRTWVDGEVGLDPGGEVIFATIWDGGGRDRYDLSAYRRDLRLDLRPGEHSVLDRDQLADLGGGPNGGHARGSVFNALQYRGDRRSLIEDATGGRRRRPPDRQRRRQPAGRRRRRRPAGRALRGATCWWAAAATTSSPSRASAPRRTAAATG